MRLTCLIVVTLILATFNSCREDRKPNRGLPGNDIIDFVQSKKNKEIYIDPVDDTIHFKTIFDRFYEDKNGHIYILTHCFRPLRSDTLTYLEYYKDVTVFVDLNTYRNLKKGFFKTRNKVYLWWFDSGGEYPFEVAGADPDTFIPFDDVAGGTDKDFVYYGGPVAEFQKIEGANPRRLKVLNPSRGCWNCGSCYFTDDKNVYYGLNKIAGADPKTFRLVNKEKLDAKDKNHRYYEGRTL